MENLLVEYFLNSIWQVPLLAAGAWLLLRALRPGPLVRHWIWLGVLSSALAMPLLSLHNTIAIRYVPIATQSRGPLPVATLLPVSPTPKSQVPHASQSYRDLGSPPASQVGREGLEQMPGKTLTPTPATPLPSPTTRAHWPLTHDLQFGPTATHLILGFYLASILFALIRLFLGWRAIHRMLARAEAAQLSPADSDLLNQCCRRLRVQRPNVLESGCAASPMLVGIARAALILPLGLTNQPLNAGAPPNRDLEAILLHELAHLRRRDCLANLLCRILALPIAYHPAAWAIRQRIRQTQEMLCDAIAAAAMESPVNYARCLVNLAQGIGTGSEPFAQIYGATMFDGKILEERVMRLIETKPAVRLRTRIVRLACSVTVMLAVLATVSIFHLTPTLAQTPTSTPPAASAAVPSPVVTPAPAQPRPLPRPRPAVRPAPPSAAPQPAPTAQATPPSDPVDYNALQIQYDYARKLWEAFVTRKVEAASRGETVDAPTRSLEFKEQMDAARKQFEDASRAMEDATAKHNQALAQRQESLQALDMQKQRAQQLQAMQTLLQDPRIKQQIEKAQATLSDPEVKKQIDSAIKQLAEAHSRLAEKLNAQDVRKALANADAQMKTPEYQRDLKELNTEAQQLGEALRQIQKQEEIIRNSLHDAPAPQSAPPAPAKAP